MCRYALIKGDLFVLGWERVRWVRWRSITLTSTQVRVQPSNTYNHTYIKFLPGQRQNIQAIWTINNKSLPMATHPKVLGLALDPKLTYSTHIHNISVQAHKPLQIIKALTETRWGKQKDTLMATYKAVMRPGLEYASSVWSPIASSTSINKLQVMQNTALRTATGCTQDTNIQHLHDETLTLPIHKHLQLHASQYKQKTQHPSHPLHKHTTYFNTPRLKTLFLTTAATQQTFPQTPTQSLQQT